MIVLLVALIVGWVLLTVAASETYAAYWWAVLTLGLSFLGLVLIGVVLYLRMSIMEIALNQRQSNFIDSVTHELKSPIASLRLYLQTLSRRPLTEAQRGEFHQFMLEDLERLDTLINHLLDAARVESRVRQEDVSDVDLLPLLTDCARLATQRYRLDESAIRLDVSPVRARGRALDLEIVFRNLIDNAVKYAGTPPQVTIEAWADGRGLAIVRVTDNGAGIPQKWRRKIFARFVRLGNELERAQPGTGLGLHIVKTLVRRMHGRINVRSPLARAGTTFEVELPAGQ